MTSVSLLDTRHHEFHGESEISLKRICQDKIFCILRENGFSDRLIKQLSKLCPNHLMEPIFEMMLEQNLKISDAVLVSYFTPHRTVIKINHAGHIRNSLFKLIGMNCPQLFKVDLSDCVQVSNSVIRTILCGCPLLESVVLDRCHKITDAAFDFTACPFDAFVGCLQLESISLQGCPQITGEIVYTLNKNFRRLIHLNLQQCKNVRLPCLQQVFSHNTLRTLNLAFIDDVSDELFSVLPPTVSLSSVGSTLTVSPPLRALNLCRSKITDSSIFKIVCMVDLEEIHLPWCTGITDAGIVALVINCTKLKVIDLKSCPITDVALSAIGDRCAQLLELDLSWCFSVTDEGLLHLLPQSNNIRSTLTVLSLIWCPQITDRSLQILSRISSLQRLQLKGCSEVSAPAIHTLSLQGVEVDR